MTNDLKWLEKSSNPYSSGNKEYSIDNITWLSDTSDFDFELYGVENDTVFRAIVADLNVYGVGDVIIGEYTTILGEGLLWDDSEGILKIKGTIEAGNINADLVTITNLEWDNFAAGAISGVGADRSIPESVSTDVSTVQVIGGVGDWTTIVSTGTFSQDVEEGWIVTSTMCTDSGESSIYHVALRIKETGASNYYPSLGGIGTHLKKNNIPQIFTIQIPTNVNLKSYDVQISILESVTLTFDSYATYWSFAPHNHAIS